MSTVWTPHIINEQISKQNPDCNEGELKEEGLYKVNLIHNCFETSVKKQSTPDAVLLKHLR